MKYIRTKDEIYGVYFVKDNGVNIETKAYFETKDKRFFLHDFIPNKKIIKQANTIEELCDAFIVKFKSLIINIYYDFEYEIPKEYKNDSDNIIYGAIWTDKGLQFVARMNSEGVLELL